MGRQCAGIDYCERRQGHPRADGAPNPYAPYDVGQAVAHMSIQAESSGLRVHQMAGFDAQQVRDAFEIPEGFNPLTVIAIGYFGGLDQLPDDLQERESVDRTVNRGTSSCSATSSVKR